MWSVLATAWRVVLRRIVSDRVILSATAVTILLATILVASGPIYSDAVTLSALTRTLDDAADVESSVQISARVTAESFTATDDLIFREVAATFAATGAAGLRRATSESYALPHQTGETVREIAVFRYFEDIASHADLTAGDWPGAEAVPYETAVPASTAAFLGLGVGDQLELTNRRDENETIAVRVVGIYAVHDPGDPFWLGDELDLNGVSVGSSFTTYGPFVTDLETLLVAATPQNSEVDWRIFPAHENLEVSQVDDQLRELEALEPTLNAGRRQGNRIRVETGLVEILEETERSLLVTRGTVFTLTAQFSMLAGYALLLTAGLLARSRQIEIDLLRARGAGSSQVLAMAGMEGALLTVPAAVIAPLLASLLLRGFNSVGPLAGIALTIDPGPTLSSYVVVAVAAAGCLVALTVPTYRTARLFGNIRARRAREPVQSVVQRAGLDVALLIVAGIALWQLQRFGAPITETVKGRFGIDPLLVAAPALGLLAGGVVALRSLPMLSRVAEAVTSRSTMLVPTLGAWQVSRRPRRYARAALLLTLAAGIGIFAVAYGTTWTKSQADQAAFQVGADLRVEPNEIPGIALPARVLRDAYDDLPGFAEAVPVLRESGRLSRSSETARFLLLDAARAAATVELRPDLSNEPLSDLMSVLAANRYSPAQLPLEGEPARIAVDVTLTVDPLPDDYERPPQIPPARIELDPRLRLVFIDAEHQLFRLDLGDIPQDGAGARLNASLVHPFGDGGYLRPAYPLSLAAIELWTQTPRDVVRHADIVIDGIYLSPDRSGDAWLPLPDDAFPTRWALSLTDPRLPVEQPALTVVRDERSVLHLDLLSGTTVNEAPVTSVLGMRPGPVSKPEALPVLMSRDLMDEIGLEIGDDVPLNSLAGFDGTGVVVAPVEEFPTVDPLEEEPVIVDYPSFVAARYAPGAPMSTPDEIWLSIRDEDVAEAHRALLGAPYESAAVWNRAEREASFESDPVARGTIGSLLLGFIAAAVLAIVGFAVNLAVSARERLGEFALLRSAGLSGRQLLAWLTVENALLVGFGLLAGTGLGLILSWLVLPLTAIAQDGSSAVPEIIVVYPWGAIALILAGILAVLLVAVWILSLSLRHRGLGELIRLGGE